MSPGHILIKNCVIYRSRCIRQVA